MKALLKSLGFVFWWAVLNGFLVSTPTFFFGFLIFPKDAIVLYTQLVTGCSLVLTIIPFALVWFMPKWKGYAIIFLFGGWVGGIAASIVLWAFRFFGPYEAVWAVTRIILPGGLIGAIGYLLYIICDELKITRPALPTHG